VIGRRAFLGGSLGGIFGSLLAAVGLKAAAKPAPADVLEMNGPLMYRTASVGPTRYVWETTPDERVRPEHMRLEPEDIGQIISVHRPPEFVGWNQAGDFVAVGGDGSVQTSPDGVTWTDDTLPTLEEFRDYMHNESQLVKLRPRIERVETSVRFTLDDDT
jgi:hypothetical protein